MTSDVSRAVHGLFYSTVGLAASCRIVPVTLSLFVYFAWWLRNQKEMVDILHFCIALISFSSAISDDCLESTNLDKVRVLLESDVDPTLPKNGGGNYSSYCVSFVSLLKN